MKKAETSSESPEIKRLGGGGHLPRLNLTRLNLNLKVALKDLLGAVDDNKREVANPKLMEENLLFQEMVKGSCC